MAKKQNMTEPEKLLHMIEEDRIKCQEMLGKVLERVDFWKGMLVLDTVIGITAQVQIRNAGHQRGGGGKRTQYKYQDIVYESGVALCKKLEIAVEGDSAPRKIERYMATHPESGIEVVAN